MHTARSRRLLSLALVAAGAMAPAPSAATTLLQMDLEALCGRAHRIFRGTVLSARAGSVEAGGGRIPTVTYRIRVDESFKGDDQEVKGLRIAEVRMVGKPEAAQSGNARFLSVLRDLPRLETGQTYLLLTTAPSSAGLSATVGLGQGAFQVLGREGAEQAVNAYGNRGLFPAPPPGARVAAATPAGPGPVPYAMLAEKIRAIVGGR